MSAVALSDHNVMNGTAEFLSWCQKEGIKPIIGMETDCLYHDRIVSFLLLARDDIGLKGLFKLSSIMAVEHRPCTLEELQAYKKNCFVIVYGEGGWFDSELMHKDMAGVREKLTIMQAEIGTFDVALSYQDSFFWSELNASLRQTAAILHIPCVAVNKIYYLEKDGWGALRAVRAIAENKKLSDTSLPPLKGRYFKDEQEMQALYDTEVLQRTEEIASQCFVTGKTLHTSLPAYPLPPGVSAEQFLTKLCAAGLKKRCHGNVDDRYTARLKYELSVIIRMHFEDYFLIVYDYILFAKKHGIRVGPGRGSAAGSLAAYCLGITEVDPLQYGLLFERFLNPERVSMPDIDTDFPDDKRNEVIAYVREKYGREHTAGIVAYGTLKPRAAVRYAGKILDLYEPDVNVFLKVLGDPRKLHLEDAVQQNRRLQRMISTEKKYSDLYAIAKDLEDLPRNLTQHAAGVVISKDVLTDVVPMADIGSDLLVTQFEAKYLEERGLIKMDFLGLRNLSIIDRIVLDIQKKEPLFSLRQIDYNDPMISEVFQKGDTAGIFQFEADDMKRFLRQLKPDCFTEITAANALRRPGASDGIPDYIANRNDSTHIQWLDESLKPILKETYGIMVYQEQAMQTVQKMAGFSLGKADLLRKAISKKDEQQMQEMARSFVSGCIKNGYTEEKAQEVWKVIAKFGEYGFNKSHAVAYTMISCQLAYLKVRYPLYFYCSLLNGVIGDSSKTAVYVDECRRQGITIEGPSVVHSTDLYMMEDTVLLMPLSCIKEVGTSAAKALTETREEYAFTDFYDFVSRGDLAGLRRSTLENIIKAGAADEFGLSRNTMLQGLDNVLSYAELSHVKKNGKIVMDYDLISKPRLIQYKDLDFEKSLREKEVLGFSLHDDAIRAVKQHFNIDTPGLAAITAQYGKEVKGFGLITNIRELVSKQGRKYCRLYVTDGMTDVKVGVWPSDYQKIRDILQPYLYVLFIGKVNEEGQIQASRIKFFKYKEKK